MASLRLVCLSLLGSLVLSAGAAAAAPDLNEVEDFKGFPVYFAGEEVAGLPLETVLGEDWREPRAQTWIFIYGDCDPPRGEGGCRPPLQIHSQSTCKRWAAALGHERRLYGFKGAKAHGGGGRYEVSAMEIFTGRATVVIGGADKAVVKAAARALRKVGASAPQERLPAPVAGSLAGKLGCQKKPGYPDVSR